ncbi:hypothetical protein MTBLM1_40140 [Rhodospirillaceae bacterium LM-1]|nr:hypothetical protein MTBLM1_40140 [Rhodospirillaceae bacterium LM-1]
MWTAAFRALNEEFGKPVLVTSQPKLSDLLSGYLYNREISFASDPVFLSNDRLIFNEQRPKGTLERRGDLLFQRLLAQPFLKALFERFLLWLSALHSTRHNHLLVNIDLLAHSYAATERKDRLIWRSGAHAVEIILNNFHVRPRGLQGELYFSPEEESHADRLLDGAGLAVGGFIVIEPGTKTDYFGTLRAWPMERWQETLDILQLQLPDIRVAQIGFSSSPLLAGVADLRGTNFRTAAAIIARARLFLGSDGGMMHAARAVNTNAVIVWGGLCEPGLLAYEDFHRIIHKRVDCSPCGLLGNCPNGHLCMSGILAQEVADAIRQEISIPS